MNRYRHLPTYRYYPEEGYPLNLDKSVGKDLRDYKIYGNSVQEGENLFNPSITLTDGMYLNNAGTEVSHASWKVTDYIEVNGYSFTLTNVGGMSPSVCAYDENKNFITGVNYGTTNADTKTSVTITSETLIKYIRISIYRVWVEQNTINDIKLQYVPTPDTPIEVISVGEKTKNLLPINDDYTMSYRDLSLSIENDVITLNGYINTNMQFGFYRENGKLKGTTAVIGVEKDTPNLMSLKAGTYALSLKHIGGTFETAGTSVYFGLYTRKGGVNLVDIRHSLTAKDAWYKFTITEDKDVQFFVLQFVGQTYPITFNNFKIKVQIEEGSTATEYEPYGYKIPVKVRGKNLIPYPYYMNVTNPYYGITWKVNEDGSITLDGTATGSANLPLISMSVPITFKKGTYTISGNNIQDSGVRLWFREVGSGTVLTSSYNGNSGKLTLTKDSKMYVYITVNPGVTLENATIYPLLEVGDTATEYESYVEPVTTNIYLKEPLRKTVNYADYIDFETKKVIRKIVKNTMTGTEAVESNYAVNESGYMWVMLARTHVVEAYCTLSSHFKALSSLTLKYVGEGISANTNGAYIIISINANRLSGDLTTGSGRIRASKTWFAEQYELGTPVEIYYVLKTYDDTEIIELPNIPTIKGTTIIEVDTTIEPTLQVQYYK